MKLQANEAPRPRGFTLIELLVVIAIIGLLSSIVLASLSTARAKAADASIMETMIGIRTSAEVYFGDNGDSYDDTIAYPERACLNASYNGVTWSPAIAQAIQHAVELSGEILGLSRCASNAQSYTVASVLKTPASPGCLKYYCVDSKGTSILTAHLTTDLTGIILGSSVNEFSCGPSTGSCTP